MASACSGSTDARPERVPSVRILRVTPPVAPGVACDAQDNLEEPRARTMPPVFELVEALVRDDEDLLRPVLDVGLEHPEAAQVAPDEVGVGLVECPEAPRTGFGVRGHRHGNRT